MEGKGGEEGRILGWEREGRGKKVGVIREGGDEEGEKMERKIGEDGGERKGGRERKDGREGMNYFVLK